MRSSRYHPVIYWAVVVATTIGTTTSAYFDRTLSLGYVKSSAILLCAVFVLLAAWRYSTGAIRVDQIANRKDEICRDRVLPEDTALALKGAGEKKSA